MGGGDVSSAWKFKLSILKCTFVTSLVSEREAIRPGELELRLPLHYMTAENAFAWILSKQITSPFSEGKGG